MDKVLLRLRDHPRSSCAEFLLKISPHHEVKNVEDAHREKAPSNKSSALTKSMNMSIWLVGTSNELFIRGS